MYYVRTKRSKYLKMFRPTCLRDRYWHVGIITSITGLVGRGNIVTHICFSVYKHFTDAKYKYRTIVKIYSTGSGCY